MRRPSANHLNASMPGREIADAARLAAVAARSGRAARCRPSALPARAWRGRRSRPPFGRPGGLAVLLAAGGEAARLAAEGGEQPEAGARSCSPPSSGSSPSRRACAPSGESETAPMRSIRHSVSTSISLTLRSAIRLPGFVVFVAAPRLPSIARASLQRSSAFASGHSPAVMLYITVSRIVPSRRTRVVAQHAVACRAPSRSIARWLAKLKLSVRQPTSLAPSVSNAWRHQQQLGARR